MLEFAASNWNSIDAALAEVAMSAAAATPAAAMMDNFVIRLPRT
jgi:hypothetical protein